MKTLEQLIDEAASTGRLAGLTLWPTGDSRLAYTNGGHPGAERQQRSGEQRQFAQDDRTGRLVDPNGSGREPGERHDQAAGHGPSAAATGFAGSTGPINGLWRDADWLFCRDGKWRPVEPGTFPLAHGAAERVGRLRGYGNAIVAPAAQAFIEAYLEAEEDRHLRLTEPSVMTPDILG